jgi:hypothetical protein
VVGVDLWVMAKLPLTMKSLSGAAVPRA